MKLHLPAGLWRWLGMAAVVALAAPAAEAQCPTAAVCTPGAASSPQAPLLGLGIFNVSLGSINNTTLGQADGYRDYSCTVGTALTVGQSYTLSVRTSPTAGASERVSAWIDYDNSGSFDANELIMNGNVAVGLHTASFVPPAGPLTVLALPLRMRVASDFASATPPGPCTTPLYSQTEDYAVTLNANSSPPTAVFTTDGTTTCSGCVQFTDASQNVPTSWAWTFGDGGTSTLPNPRYCYTTPGTYPVTLTTTNAAGSATSAATSITYNNVVPAALAAGCTPTTTAYFAGYGITRFRFLTIDNASADGRAGFEDFTCTQRATAVAGRSYPFTINTGGSSQHALRIYLDANNDGNFLPGEVVYENLTAPVGGLTANLALPGTALTGVPLRLRLVADFVGASLGGCANRTNGQDEDYTLQLTPNTLPPVVNFTSDYVAGGCVNPVQFSDQTTNLDAGTSWLWNFGDGTTSTLQNPSHRYLAAGTYTVSLTVTNSIGTVTATKASYLSITLPCFSYCPSNGTGGQGGAGPLPSQFWMTNVAITAASPDANGTTYAPFSNASGNSFAPSLGYSDFTNLTATLRIGQSHTMTVMGSQPFTHRTVAWIDAKPRDGIFDTGERVVNVTGTPAARISRRPPKPLRCRRPLCPCPGTPA